LITPEELTNPSVDEKSVMTYLSQFPRAQPQQLGQISELDRNPLIGIPTTFVVQFDKPYLQSEIIIVIMDPHGRKIPAEISLSADDPTKHEAKFVPTVIGKHKVGKLGSA
jgi:filamin